MATRLREPNCTFCNPNPDRVVFETALSYASVPDRPASPGHVVVVTKNHLRSLETLSEGEASDVFALSNRVAKVAAKQIGAERVYSLSIGDVDPHFHVHLLPKLREQSPLGPYVFGDKGWTAEDNARKQPFDQDSYARELKRLVSG